MIKFLGGLLLNLREKNETLAVSLVNSEGVFGNQVGAIAGMGILYGLISVVVVIIVLANAIPLLWPMATDASDNITAMTGTDAGTTMIQGFWPIILLLIGLGVAIGLLVFAMRKFGIMT